MLFNRTNCCSSRLSNFTVSVLDENDNAVWSQFYANTPSPSLAINLNASGRKVRVNLDGTLSLAEVQVFGTSDAAQTNEASNSNFFTAHKISGQKVGLSWLVDHTSNPIQYEIEYKNEEGSFESIGVVADKGESYNVYSFTDENPKIGNNTYRIKVLYEDYTIQYLAPRTISFDENDQSIVFPNPTEGNLFIDLSEYLGQKVVMTLTDLSGKVYLSKNLDSNHSERVNMNISNFRNGLYVLHIKPENRKAKAEKISLLRPY